MNLPLTLSTTFSRFWIFLRLNSSGAVTCYTDLQSFNETNVKQYGCFEHQDNKGKSRTLDHRFRANCVNRLSHSMRRMFLTGAKHWLDCNWRNLMRPSFLALTFHGTVNFTSFDDFWLKSTLSSCTGDAAATRWAWYTSQYFHWNLLIYLILAISFD